MLKELYHAKPKLAEAIIPNCKPELIRCIADCALNLNNKTIKLSSKEKKRLRRHASGFRVLASKRSSVISKRRVLQKGSGFLTALLGPIIATIASVFGGSGK